MKAFVKYIGQHKVLFFFLCLLVLLFIGYQLLFKHPIAQYTDIEVQTIERISSLTSEYENDENKLHKRLKNEASKQEWILSGNVNLGEFSKNAMLLRGILANSRIVVNSKSDPSAKETSAKINIQLQRTSLIKADFYQNQNYTAINIPIYPESIGIKNDRLGNWLESSGYATAITEVPSTFDTQKNFSFSLMDYMGFLKRLSEYDTTVKENVNYKGQSLQRFQLNMTEEQVEGLIDQIVQSMKENRDDSNFFGKQINELEQLIFPEGLVYEAYYNNEYVSFRTLKGQVEMEGKSREFELNVDTEIEGDNYQLRTELTVAGQQPFQVNYSSQGQPQGSSYLVYNNLDVDRNKEPEMRLDWKTTYHKDSKDISFDLYAPSYLPRLEGNLTSKTNIITDQANQTLDWVINVNQIKANLTMNRDVQFEESVDIDRINAQDTKFLHQLTEEQNKQVMQDLKQSFRKYAEKLIDQFNPF